MFRQIVSGGQTGVDRGALDAALMRDFPCGGWCPKGRRAEDGVIPPHYPLQETASARYLERTRRNVAEADATLILVTGPLTGGTLATRRHAEKTAKPILVIDLSDDTVREALNRVCDWLSRCEAETLNVAGPRESGCPGIATQARDFVGALLDRISSS